MSKITEVLNRRLSNITTIQNERKGTPLVTVDTLADVHYPLAILTQLVLLENCSTKEEFNMKHAEAAIASGMLMNQSSSDRGNLRKQVLQNRVSWDVLEKILRVCGYDIEDVAITVVSRETNQRKVIKMSDKEKYVRQYRPTVVVDKI